MAMIPAQYVEALELEQALGDPGRPDNLLSFHHAMTLDEDDAFPEAAIGRLHMLGVHHCYVPEQLGGRFRSSETFIALGRVLARRNMSVAVSYSTMLWSVLAWIGGDRAQQQRTADWVLHAGEFPCLAYSEAEHGADLRANSLTAEADGTNGYRLSGEKWPVNRATRSGFVVLLARTDAGRHLRNHSLFVVSKRDLDCGRYYHLPRVKTHGLRGCDISGIGFRDCKILASDRIGKDGHGLELALKGFQVTRTFCTALSLGVGDSALRLVVDFASRRTLYGTTVISLPQPREVLANAYLSQLIGECTAIVAARGLHFFTKQFSSWSSIAKVQVTYLVDHACQKLAGVLGARFYMREGEHHGIFQKLLRDGAIVSVFDGSSIVCLDSLATLLPGLVRRHERTLGDCGPLYNLQHALPALDLQRLDLSGRSRDAVTASLPQLLDMLDTLQASDLTSQDTLDQLRLDARGIEASLVALESAVFDESEAHSMRNSAAMIGYAECFCSLHAAICSLGLWLHNRSELGSFFAAGEWLLAALARRGEAVFQTGSLHPNHADALMTQLILQFQSGCMFSVLKWPLAPAGSAEFNPLFHPTTPEKPHDVSPA